MQTKFTELRDSQWEIIEKFVNHHQPRKHSLRTILNAILWICRTGSQWRNLESKYPPWESVYYYFSIWSQNGTLNQILGSLVEMERQGVGREPQPSAVSIDSQSVKSVPFVEEGTKGVDGGKKVKGRKRHIIVDTDGLPLVVWVSPANLHDGEAGVEMLWQLEEKAERLELIRTDGSYGGYFQEIAEGIYGWKVNTTQRPPSQKGFIPEKGRWPVERSFGWLNFFRRLAKDFEKTTQSAVAFIQIAFISVMLAMSSSPIAHPI